MCLKMGDVPCRQSMPILMRMMIHHYINYRILYFLVPLFSSDDVIADHLCFLDGKIIYGYRTMYMIGYSNRRVCYWCFRGYELEPTRKKGPDMKMQTTQMDDLAREQDGYFTNHTGWWRRDFGWQEKNHRSKHWVHPRRLFCFLRSTQ